MDQAKIGKFISDRRKKQGLTQKQLADQLNVTDKTVSKWETGIDCQTHRSFWNSAPRWRSI